MCHPALVSIREPLSCKNNKEAIDQNLHEISDGMCGSSSGLSAGVEKCIGFALNLKVLRVKHMAQAGAVCVLISAMVRIACANFGGCSRTAYDGGKMEGK